MARHRQTWQHRNWTLTLHGKTLLYKIVFLQESVEQQQQKELRLCYMPTRRHRMTHFTCITSQAHLASRTKHTNFCTDN